MAEPRLDPQHAKRAAQLLRIQQDRLELVEKRASDLEAELTALKRGRECLKFAHQLSELGRIPKDFASIEAKAAEMDRSGRDLTIIKEAIDMSQQGFELGTVASKPGSGQGLDPITEVLMEGL